MARLLARTALLLTLAVGLASTAQAQAPQDAPVPPANVAGKWQTTLEMEVGTATVALAFAQEGEKLTGTYTGRYGAYQLAGTVKGRQLDFIVTIIAEGTETQMIFTGTLDAAGDVIKGAANLGGMGEAGWIARRPK